MARVLATLNRLPGVVLFVLFCALPLSAQLTITTNSLPGGTVGSFYSQSLGATGGTLPYTWRQTLGALPSGLSLNADSGLISGTPTTVGIATFTVQLTDTASPIGRVTQSLSIAIGPAALSITTSSLAQGTVGVPYSQSLFATGGTMPYSWSLIVGTLPAGLGFNASAGVISGVPTTPATINFAVRVTDSGTPLQTATASFFITIVPPPLRITTTSLAEGTVGSPYSQLLAAIGGTAPYSWSLAVGTLPAGLSLNAGTGVISGTPGSEAALTFIVRVTDSGTPQQSVTATLPLTIVSPPLRITTMLLAGGAVGSPYSQLLAATGGTAPYSWSVAVGTLPAGLSLNAGSGVISGTPTAPGNANFGIQVKDSSSRQQTVVQGYSVRILTEFIITTPNSLGAGVPTVDYSRTLEATGGIPPYRWFLLNGQLPPGIVLLREGVLAGTPTTTGTFDFTIGVAEAGERQATKSFSLVIQNTLTITNALPLPRGVIGVFYSQQLRASIASPVTWSLSSGSLPTGISLSSEGLLSGTPSTGGDFDFFIHVSGGNPVQTTTQPFQISVNSALVISSQAPLPDGIIGEFYSFSLDAAGGVIPYTWIQASGILPPGVSLSPAGFISGTPAALGVFTFAVQVRDNSATPLMTSRTFTLTITPSFPVITTSSLSPGIQAMNYSQQLQATGGSPPYVWTAGTLPTGLTLSTSGLLSGIPTAATSGNVVINLTDARSVTTSRTFPLTVLPLIDTVFVTNVPPTLATAQQPVIVLSVRSAYPIGVSGQLTLSFAPNAAVTDDPMVQFSNGTRTAGFDIPANSTTAVFSSPLRLLTGTIAGSIQITASIQNGPANMIAGVFEILPAAPQITNLEAAQTSAGIVIRVTGYSATRSVTGVEFGFDLRTSSGIQRVNLTRNVEPDFAAWYLNPVSAAFGSAFVFVQSFNLQGDGAGIETVTVTLTNAQGSTSSSQVPVVRQ